MLVVRETDGVVAVDYFPIASEQGCSSCGWCHPSVVGGLAAGVAIGLVVARLLCK
jgi:hypothetical protein